MPSVTRYLTVDGEILSEKQGAAKSDYLPDPLGSTAALLNSSQTKTDSYTYWPYGEERTSSGSTPTPFRYVGTLGYRKDDSSRTYVKARVLNPGRASWMTVDPIWPEESAFSYSHSSPTSYYDRSGAKPQRSKGANGCGPDYNPRPFNKPGMVLRNNCFSYACNKLNTETGSGRNSLQREMGGWPQPGGPGCWSSPFSCSKLMTCLRKHGVLPIPASGKCPPGTFKVTAYLKGPQDPSNYHIVRQDSNGRWSCKCGGGEVGPQFDDPDSAANSNPVSPGYKRCFVVCFPCDILPRT